MEIEERLRIRRINRKDRETAKKELREKTQAKVKLLLEALADKVAEMQKLVETDGWDADSVFYCLDDDLHYANEDVYREIRDRTRDLREYDL